MNNDGDPIFFNVSTNQNGGPYAPSLEEGQQIWTILCDLWYIDYAKKRNGDNQFETHVVNGMEMKGLSISYLEHPKLGVTLPS